MILKPGLQQNKDGLKLRPAVTLRISRQEEQVFVLRRDASKKPEFVHTLNGSGLATSRLMVSLLETYQTGEGTIKVPEVLQKYTGFAEIK